MSAETWFSADEFVTAGFADTLSDDEDDDGGMENVSVKTFNKVLKSYKNLPEALKTPDKKTAKSKYKAVLADEVTPEPVTKPEPNSNLSLYAAKAKLRRTK
jgi:hypothetical protein